MKAEHFLPIAFWLVSCGGGAASGPPPEAPPPAHDPPAEDMPAPVPAAATAQPDTTPPPSAVKIEFPPHASVDQAVKAVPQGASRLNMSDDVLHAPLLDLKRYDTCKVPRSTKVTLTVAVYDGAAVGVDVTTKPKNAKLDECLDGVVRGMSWDKVPS